MERPSDTPVALMLGSLFGVLFGCVMVLGICAWQARAAWIESATGDPAGASATTVVVPGDAVAQPFPNDSSGYGETPTYALPVVPNATTGDVQYYAAPAFSSDDMVRENDGGSDEEVDGESTDDEP